MAESTPPSRREFLDVARAAALIGSLAASLPAAELKSDRKLRVGVVGGGFGASFQWHLDPNCVVEAVSDLRPDRRSRLQKIYKCEKPYESLEKLVLDPRVEAVAVFTEAPNHARHVLECFRHGKHVISAVPACCSLDEAAAMKEAKEKTGLRYMMAETSYYRAACILTRGLWDEGRFGNFLYSEVEYYHPNIGHARDALSHWAGKRTWRFGYPPMLYPTHSLGFHVGVTRERITHVACIGWKSQDPAFLDNPYKNPFASQTALLLTNRGNVCRCTVFWHGDSHGERAQWMGQELAMYMGGWSGQPFVIKRHGKPDIRSHSNFFHLLPEPMRVRTGHGGSHTFITHEFVAALAEGREPAVDLYEALAMTVPGIVAMDSARKGGEQLAVPSFDKA